MSFSDPLVLTLVDASTKTFNRVSEGSYVLASSTLDQPVNFTVDRTIDPNKVSSYVIKLTEAKNVASISGLPIPDDVLQVHIVFKVPHRSFAAADVVNLFDTLYGFNDPTLIGRILRGER